MDGLQYRLREEMDSATRALIDELVGESGGVSQHAIMLMVTPAAARQSRRQAAAPRGAVESLTRLLTRLLHSLTCCTVTLFRLERKSRSRC